MRSIRRALLMYLLAGLLLVLAISGFSVYAAASSSFRMQHDEALAARAGTFASLIIEEPHEPDEPDEDYGLVFDFKGSLREEDIGVLLRIVTDQGTVLAESPGWPTDRTTPPQAPQPGGAPILSDVRINGAEAARAAAIASFAAAEPVEDVPVGTPLPASRHVAIVEVIGRTDAVHRAESAVLFALILGGLLAVVGASAAVWLGVTRGLVPVRRLGGAMDRLGPQDLSSSLSPENYPRELAPIITSVEGLLKRLREAVERERRFTDAAAHELRTPIAELRTITDVANKWPEEPRLRAAITEARAIADEMEALLVVLLAAARGGAAYQSQPSERVPLLPLARTIAAGRLANLHRRGVSCTFDGDDRAEWHGPRGAILAIVRNLIDNAAEYTPDGGAVRIMAAQNGKGVRFEIENGPVSLGADEAQRIFEPFWRADRSRSDRTHRGLGLSIVATLAEGLHLRRESVVTHERRLRVTLTSL